MLVDRKDILLVYRQLFEDGVFTTIDDVHATYVLGKDENGEDITISNLKVIKLLQSLCSRGYVNKTYSWWEYDSWCHFYYTLTDSGLQYLREFLHLPNDIVPNTYRRVNPTLPREERPRFHRDGDKPRFRRDGERRQYRNNRSGFDKEQPKEN
ncbi:40S ribosomal protein [Blastocystis sp. subtype 4]|uniref:40S ribosomal protein n=1 Tax=Blastocystis sp. subtype 4 TaxID=944170 RepID=UPI000711ADAB|nr:40S ribosomal protein [Blastocystis sp. subtype 4]KNB45445.1 40S ribosomal protein [Blastocystis sp. subtype 4]|eukprot:XP_014528886.1 40S ribosomal protein [Blastocystis sp. subtype 4]